MNARKPTRIRGPVYVVGDNIDTDQIIPAEHLALVPTNPAEYRRLGSLALCGLPHSAYSERLVAPGAETTRYPIILAGRNFGCGSSREHAPIALGAAGVVAVVAESYARIFFRNCIATGELYPAEAAERLCERFRTGDEVELNLEAHELRPAAGAPVRLGPLGEAARVVAAGGLFAYARATGLVPTRKETS